MSTDARTREDSFDYARSRGESISAMLTDSDKDMLLQSLDVQLGGENTPARSIPVPTKTMLHPLQPPSQASSQGSSGSGFMSSVLNMNPSAAMSHTPPNNVSSSYEASHFGKRARSGSISGRLQSASEYLQDKGMLDQSTKAILKDLIILGDSELQTALDKYEQDGDASMLEEMINSGSLQHRLPTDLDLLGDLDLDFMTMKDEPDIMGGGAIEPLRGSEGKQPAYVPSKSQPIPRTAQSTTNFPTMPDDGIGDLEFAGDFMSGTETDYIMQMPAQALSSAAASPSADSYLSEQERRLRSNSLFSALLDPPVPVKSSSALVAEQQNGQQWLDQHDFANNQAQQRGIRIAARRASAPEKRSALAESLDLAKPVTKTKYKKREKQSKQKEDMDAEEEEEYVPGSGRPRTFSDPNLHTYIDSTGLMQVDRPEGWVGAYSPESRKVRIDRFLAKRSHRVWSKTIKYDVRKNFADSRLRVKGRFVRKEDELMMRELMSLT